MKRYFFVLFIFISQNIQSIPSFEESRNRFENAFRQWQDSVYGAEDASLEIQLLVEVVAKQCGVDFKKIRCKKTKLFPKNAIAAFSGIWIDEEWFVTLSRSQQEAIIAHELMHIKHKDAHRTILVGLLILACYGYGRTRLENNIDENYKDSLLKTLVVAFFGHLALNLGTFGLFVSFKRYLEKQADIDAAHSCQCHEGLIEYCQSPDPLIEALKKLNVRVDDQAQWHDKAIAKIVYLLSTHPSHEERIAYLKEDLGLKLCS